MKTTAFVAFLGPVPTLGEVFEGMVKYHIGQDSRVKVEDFTPADTEAFRAVLLPIVKQELEGPIAELLKAADPKALLVALRELSATVAKTAVTRYLQSLMPAQ